MQKEEIQKEKMQKAEIQKNKNAETGEDGGSENGK